MAFTSYLLIIVPIALAFAVLYYLDEDLKRRVNNSFLKALLAIFIGLVILFFGLGYAVSVLA
ncbi:MAG: hypothetical protein V4676_09015 [Bacteroidota bacterium]